MPETTTANSAGPLTGTLVLDRSRALAVLTTDVGDARRGLVT
jgi:hypothetical protein